MGSIMADGRASGRATEEAPAEGKPSPYGGKLVLPRHLAVPGGGA